MPKQKPTFNSDQYEVKTPQAGMLDESLFGPPAARPMGKIRKVEKIPVTMVIPDRFQPRIQLPDPIASRFYALEINCFQAAEEWLRMARENAFYAVKLDKIYSLADSVEEFGQIKPVTGVWSMAGEERCFFLESGERRFWSIVLDAVKRGEVGPQITIDALVQAEFNPERQAEENEKAEGLTAVGRAREIARLLLFYGDVTPDPQVHYGYCGFHRQVMEVRIPQANWERVGKITNLARPTMVQMLKILHMPDPLLEAADTYNLSVNTLYTIVKDHRAEEWEALIYQAVEELAPGVQRESGGESEEELEGERETGKTLGTYKRRQRADPVDKMSRKIKSVFATMLPKLEEGNDHAISTVATSLFDLLETEEEIATVADQLENLAHHLRMRLDQQKS